MSEVVERVREMLAVGHTKEAAAYVKRLAPVPLSEPVARQLLTMLADSILEPVSRGPGDKFGADPGLAAARRYAIFDDVKLLQADGMTLEEAYEVVGEKNHCSAKKVEGIYRSLK